MPKVIIVGAGLVGALNACYFAQLGWDTEVYEYRSDVRELEENSGRVINLTLAGRGRKALEGVGLKDEVVRHGLEITHRLVHYVDETTKAHPIARPGEVRE
uniref:Kynurenine 3-monooxygenase n=1 Tax=Acrobeloides nanus TaxID=290746 RepID=A0A914EJJ1_9BILA